MTIRACKTRLYQGFPGPFRWPAVSFYGLAPFAPMLSTSIQRDFGTICPEVQRVWGAPQQAFLRACGQQKFRSVATPELLAISCASATWRKKTKVTLSYASSVSLAFCSPSAVASMTVNSFSSIELSSLSMCWRQSLSLFCLSG